MSKSLDRNQSGKYGETHVFCELSCKGFKPRMASQNQKGYDILIIHDQKEVKIEVKHIQRSGESSKDSFILKKAQTEKGSFEYLILMVSDCTNDNIRSRTYYLLTHDKINDIISNKRSKSGNYTFNLSCCGKKIANTPLKPYKKAWQEFLENKSK